MEGRGFPRTHQDVLYRAEFVQLPRRALRRHGLPVLADHRAVERRLLPGERPDPRLGNSLLVTSLKNGALYRVPLNADGKTAQGDVTKYFHTPNRYRSVLVSPDGKTIYVATDVRGNVLGSDGKPTSDMKNPGAIIAFVYDAKQ